MADQALNPTARPGVEQNTREKSDCQIVKTAKYKKLYEQAWGEPIDCNQQGDPPAYHISFKRLAVAVAAWQGSPDVNSFSSPRDACIKREPDPINSIVDADGKFPCDNLSDAANLGHDLFFNRNDSGQNVSLKNAGCAACHNNHIPPPQSGLPPSDGNEPDQIYTDMAYHSIALPFNHELSRDDEDPGLSGHDDLGGNVAGGFFKTPPLRNVGKNQLEITKAYMHNGYFKSLAQIVHYYNTRFDGTGAPTDFDPAHDSKTVCDDPPISIVDATAAEAIANDCWPAPEFPSTVSPFLASLLGNLGLTGEQEEALVAYLETLSDAHTPTAPSTVK